jgi:hypothetical protein
MKRIRSALGALLLRSAPRSPRGIKYQRTVTKMVNRNSPLTAAARRELQELRTPRSMILPLRTRSEMRAPRRISRVVPAGRRISTRVIRSPSTNRTRRAPRTRSEMRGVRLPSRSPSRSPSNSNRTRRAPSRSPSRSSGSNSNSSNSNSNSSNSNYSISTPYYYQWKVVKLNNPPKEDIALNNFNNKDARVGMNFAKAVKVSWTLNGKKFSDYYTPRTVTGLMYTFEGRPKPGEISNRKIQSAMQRLKSSSTDPNKVVFEHPLTRANVRKKKNKAATKIQAAFRGGRERQKTLNRAKRTAALITKKRAAAKSSKRN